MGKKYHHWHARATVNPTTTAEVERLVLNGRSYTAFERLDYGDHGLEAASTAVAAAIRQGKRIALYADYDVDGTMSCVSWIWFFRAIGFDNFVHYIPCRFKEGYGLNLEAVRHLIEDEKAELIITMDTGITANAEAAFCKSRGVQFICTDHHVIQPEKMPDCIILNPKTHIDPHYRELCGCGITFVLLRRLSHEFPVPAETWTDLVALAGMATICDVVPLNGVNHRLAKQGVAALARSKRPVLEALRQACSLQTGVQEKDVGFRLGPRINAVGRLEHAHTVVKAFIDEDPGPLIRVMELCNERRKQIQQGIVKSARDVALAELTQPIVFVGGDYHPGVVGIAASKLAEEFWRPTWLFQRQNGVCKGSARSIAGFDVTAAMASVGHLFTKFGGHRAAGGFSFAAENEEAIRAGLTAFAEARIRENPDAFQSQITYDCELPQQLWDLRIVDALDRHRPFGFGFEEPRFRIRAQVAGVDFFKDKTTGAPKHTAVRLQTGQRVMFFNEVFTDLPARKPVDFIVTAERNTFRGATELALYGADFSAIS
jgi:single-stranded-DNA-specific exonuclease